ncbi:hypothetical protein HYH03_002940 [Edaphochlamys debaryana]|uniref:Apple domain-containing protein n=1 Tax=Edaphochlamys debaryana TaxID=47281 RepID=A0A835YAH7_9CHLO|nr:hypothetical protein HYH03_002940 [Edaphochlamys debaryana]|eukprot:KAG2499365.1 hypothetical protein HYH03_002940 [Edaphochlamys debaryana]
MAPSNPSVKGGQDVPMPVFHTQAEGSATTLPADLRPECAHFDSARNVQVSRFDSGAAVAWRDLQFGVAGGRNQSVVFEEIEGAAATSYSNTTGPLSAGWSLDLTSAAGVLAGNLSNWSAEPTAPFTIVVIQSQKTSVIDWQANYLLAELSCAGSPSTSGFLFGTRESYISGAYGYGWDTAFHTSKPVPIRSGWTLHAFVRRKGGTEGAYYYAGAGTSGGIALREAFTGQPPMPVGPDRLTVGTSKCMNSAKSRTQLGVVLVYNRALSVTDLKRIQETYAVRYGWSRGGSLRKSAINGSAGGTNTAYSGATTCFSRPNYGNYYCIPLWDVRGTNIRTYTPMDKSTCLGACDSDPTCQFVAVASGSDDCILKKDMFAGAVGTTQQNLGRGAAYETCIKARVYHGDGLLDAVLFDTTGARGVALSTKGCSTADADTGYPNAPASACPSVLGSLCPKPPAGWCPGGEVLQLDCDADGVKDLACILKADRSDLRVVRSGMGCWPGAADSFCPPLTANASCAYPSGSLCSPGRMLSVDCNQDSVRDWVCLGSGGQRGVVVSRGCDPSPATSGYPTVADDKCPVLFGVGNPMPTAPPNPPPPPSPSPPPPFPPPNGCPAFPGYTSQLGVDHAGDDLGNTGSLAAARAACSSRQDCRGFTSLGWIKSNVVGTMPDNPALCLYTKVNTVCQDFSGYATYSDQDRPGDDMGGPYVALDTASLP